MRKTIPCQNCGRISIIIGCRFCGAAVCAQCASDLGCKLCGGKKSLR